VASTGARGVRNPHRVVGKGVRKTGRPRGGICEAALEGRRTAAGPSTGGAVDCLDALARLAKALAAVWAVVGWLLPGPETAVFGC
jgi:hypothetical protein